MLASLLRFFRGITFSGIRSIFRKELIQLMRDPFLVAFIVTLPIVQLLVTGLAISKDLKHVATVVCNYDHNRNDSIELIKAFETSTSFSIQEQVDTEEQVIERIRQGKYRIGIIIPPDYSEKVLTGKDNANVNIIIDGTHASIAKTIQGTALSILENFNRERMTENLISPNDIPKVGLSATIIEPNTKILWNPALQTSYFLIPGILAIIMHMMTILFTSFAIVRERETGTLEQLMVTPIRVSDLMIGKVIPYALIGFLDMVLTLGVMVWFFDITISGSFWFLCIASIVFIVTSLAIGLLISTTCSSQVQAVQLTLALLLPSLLISGFVFPMEPMPWFIKGFSYLLPITYYLDIIRGVVIKGIGFKELWWHMMMLCLLSSVLLGLSIFRFKKQIA